MKTKKKLIVPIAMLVLAVMAITSTTFAWFTTNSTVNATITKASVISDGTMLFVVDQTKYAAVEQAKWDEVYYANISSGEATARDLANDAIKEDAFINDTYVDNSNWAFETAVDYENSDLLMRDLTYKMDIDEDRFDIADAANTAGWSPYAEAVRQIVENNNESGTNTPDATNGYMNPADGTLLEDNSFKYAEIWTAPYNIAYAPAFYKTYYSMYNNVYAQVYDLAYNGFATTGTSTHDLRNTSARNAISALYAKLVAGTANSSAIDFTGPSGATTDSITLEGNSPAFSSSITIDNDSAALDRILTAASEAGLASYTAGKNPSAPGGVALESKLTSVATTAETAADNAATADGKLAGATAAVAKVELTAEDNDKTYTAKYNREYADYLLTTYGVTDVQAEDYQRVAAAEHARDEADDLLADRATTAKLREANYAHYNIDNAFTVADGLYRKGVYDLKDFAATTPAPVDKVNNVVAVANEDYIDLTYTFWCLGTDAGVNRLSLVVDGSGVTSLGKNGIGGQDLTFAFTNLERTYFLTQGVKDERVAKFYGNDIGAAADDPNSPDDLIITAPDGRAYEFNDTATGTYTGNAANATRVMFTNIDQTPGGGAVEDIIGVWEPNAEKGYDQLSGGNRVYELDIQDMFNKAQTPMLFDDLAPIEYTNRYNSSTDLPLLAPNSLGEIELFDFTEDYSDADVPSSPGTYYRAQLNVKIWLEGFDSDCFNVILSDVLDIALQFKATTV